MRFINVLLTYLLTYIIAVPYVAFVRTTKYAHIRVVMRTNTISCIREYVNVGVDCIYTAHYAGASNTLSVPERRKETCLYCRYNIKLTCCAHMAMEGRSGRTRVDCDT